MASESAYAALPYSDAVGTNTSSPRFFSRVVRCRLITCVAAVIAVLATRTLIYRFPRHSSLEATRIQKDADLSPPILVVKPEMKSLHYCGLDPDDPKSIPHIPPLGLPSYELVQVQAFIRHGTRFINSPAMCWPGQEHITYNCSLDEVATTGVKFGASSLSVPRLYRKRYLENRNFFKGDCRLGQLTLKGYRQEVALGSLFRQAYLNVLLDPKLGTDQVFVRAHDIPRTVMSAQAFVTGLFPEHSSSDGFTSVADIWTMDAADDDQIINPHACPGVDDQRERARSSQAFIHHEMTVTAQLNQQLSKVVGVPVPELGTNKFDCFFISLCQGDPVPDGVDENLINALETEARYNLYYLMQYPDRVSGSRLTVGPLLYEILETIKSVESEARFSLYSGHDSGPIMLLLSAFGVEDEYWAPFSSYISLEVYRSAGQHFVRFVYNGNVRHMAIGDANGLVAFEDLQEYLAPMVPTVEECPQIHCFFPRGSLDLGF